MKPEISITDGMLQLEYLQAYRLTESEWDELCNSVKAIDQPIVEFIFGLATKLDMIEGDATWYNLRKVIIACGEDLQKLDLSRTSIAGLDAEGMSNLGKFLASCTNLKRLALCENRFDGLNVNNGSALCDAVAHCKNIEWLDISGNGLVKFINEDVSASFSEALAQLKSLKQLRLSEQHFIALGMNGCSTFLDSLKQCQSLRQLDFSKDRLEEWESNQFGGTVNVSSLSRHHYLQSNVFSRIDDNQWSDFLCSLSQTSIEKIDGINDLSEKRQKELADELQKNAADNIAGFYNKGSRYPQSLFNHPEKKQDDMQSFPPLPSATR